MWLVLLHVFPSLTLNNRELVLKNSRGVLVKPPESVLQRSLFEMCYLCDFSGKGVQRSFNHFFSQRMLISGVKLRIAHWVWDSDSRNYPIRTNRFGNRGDSCHVNNGDPVSFDFFYHRCTATSTGTSGGGEYNPIDPRVF